ncbi:hypothetical protein ACA910_004547 [Epithemia clementina (nom. ined.)]
MALSYYSLLCCYWGLSSWLAATTNAAVSIDSQQPRLFQQRRSSNNNEKHNNNGGEPNLLESLRIERINPRPRNRDLIFSPLPSSKGGKGMGTSKGNAFSKGKGTDSKGKSTDSKGKGTDSKGKGTDSKGKGDESKGKGAESKGKGTDTKGKGWSIKKTYAPSNSKLSKSKSSSKDKSTGKGKGYTASPIAKGKGIYSKSKSSKDGKSGKGGGKGKSASKSDKSTKHKWPTKKPSPKAPTVTPVFSPTPQPTPEQPVQPPTPVAPTATAPPTTDQFPTVTLSPYEILYTIVQNRFILPSEYEELANVTSEYLNLFFEDVLFNDTNADFRESFTLFVSAEFSFGDPVTVRYNTTAQFAQNSPSVPSVAALDAQLERAFTGNNTETYINFVTRGVVSTNPFETTSEVQFQFVETTEPQEQQETDPVTTEDKDKKPPKTEAETEAATTTTTTTTTSTKSSSTSFPKTTTYIGAGAAAGVVAFVLFVFGINAYDRRQDAKVNSDLMEKQSVGSHTDNDTATATSASHWDSSTTVTSKIRQHSFITSDKNKNLHQQARDEYEQNLQPYQVQQQQPQLSVSRMGNSFEDSHYRVDKNTDEDTDDEDDDHFEDDQLGDDDERFTDIPLSNHEQDKRPTSRGIYS